ncbi:MAG TPA: hypothetical protein VE988_08315 [Gemmataceae bacterium]|nr:hypothetical protein [Gemmataceae bacterium]
MTRETATMDVGQIGTWFGLPPGLWPPDHYALLGLPPGETDIDAIEERVHEKLMLVRSYQLSQPMLATEAMTQLAKAFDCLTDLERKKAYDAAHFRKLPTAPSSRMPTKIDNDTAQTPIIATPLQWQTAAAPPPVRGVNDGEVPPPMAIPLGIPVAEPVAEAVALPDVVQPVAPPKRKVFYLSASDLHLAGTRRELYERILWTRRLARAWSRAGKYLHRPRRRLTKSAEDAELTRLLHAIDDLIIEMPDLFGQPGQVGYRIVARNSQEPVADHFKSLDDDHRIALALDWTAGRKLLEEYRGLLMDEAKTQRLLAPWQRWYRAVNAALSANWIYILLVLGMIGVLVLVLAYSL